MVDAQQLADFTRYLQRSDRKNSTVNLMVAAIKKLHDECCPLTPQTFEDYLFSLKDKGRKASYINSILDTIYIWADYCGDHGFRAIKHFKVTDPIINIMSDDEILAFLALPHDPHEPFESYRRYKNFWATCAFTGARMHEIAALSINDIQFGNQTIMIKDGKTGGRVLPMAASLVPYLEDAVRTTAHDHIFATPSGKLLTDAIWGANFHKRIRMLGIKRALRPYSLRHSYGTALCSGEDSPLFVIQDMMGHKKAETTRKYFHNNILKMQKVGKKHTLNRRGLSKQEKFLLKVQEVLALKDEAETDLIFEFHQTADSLIFSVKTI